jgi:hypothetical protein
MLLRFLTVARDLASTYEGAAQSPSVAD